MEFRVARPDELGEIAILYHRVWHESQAPHQHPDVAIFRDVAFMRQRINAFYPNIIVALRGAKLIALIVANDARISQLFVDSAERGKGIGQKLLDLGEAKLVAEGASNVTLNCLVGNGAARKFYERNGWAVGETQTKMGKTHKGDVPIIIWEMEKTLDVFYHFG